MLTEPTVDKLKELSLYAMADAFIEQEQHALRSSHGQVRVPRPPGLG